MDAFGFLSRVQSAWDVTETRTVSEPGAESPIRLRKGGKTNNTATMGASRDAVGYCFFESSFRFSRMQTSIRGQKCMAY